MVTNLSKGSLSITPNLNISMGSISVEFKEEETMHQLMEEMDLVKQESQPSN